MIVESHTNMVNNFKYDKLCTIHKKISQIPAPPFSLSSTRGHVVKLSNMSGNLHSV